MIAATQSLVDGGDKQGMGPVPGQPDMWYFVLFEAVVFTAYFVAYMVYRMGNPKLFLESQAALNQAFGVANTVILLTSSLTMAMCVNAVRFKRYAAGRGLLVLTALLGVIFIGAKIAEWSLKLGEGYTLATNVFFSFYYFLTAIHVFHVLMGFVILTIVFLKLRQPSARSLETVQTGATYWHLVDFLWVFIFALLYVMR